MFIRHTTAFVLLALMLFAVACSIFKKTDSDAEVREFLVNFQNGLSQKDDDILKNFDVQQSREAILSVIHVLQDKEYKYIHCEANIGQGQITFINDSIQVQVPALFKSVQLESEESQTSMLTFWLKPAKKGYVVVKLAGEQFYNDFSMLRNNIQWSAERQDERAKREAIYALANKIKSSFDSVVWYTQYQDQVYFYVVKGEWKLDGESLPTSTHKMGLTDSTGAIVIPLEYKMIGTLGFDRPNLVEVQQDQYVGLFDLSKKSLVVPVAYDQVIPYEQGDAFVLTRKGDVYGWVDNNLAIHEGFPSAEAETWLTTFKYLKRDLHIDRNTQSLCEAPSSNEMGSGVLIPPVYLVKAGLFSPVELGISTTEAPLGGWTDYVEKGGSFFEKVTDQFNAVLTTITAHYLDGREEFYTDTRLAIVNNKQEILSVTRIPASDITVRQLGSYLEVRGSGDNNNYYEGDSYFEESELPTYKYFQVKEDLTLEELTGRYEFTPADFVKLDSSYLTGDFTRWNADKQITERTHFLSVNSLKYIRNEILAHYGFRFTDPADVERFSYRDWYKPRFDSRGDFEAELTEIDRYNLAFLDKVIDLLEGKSDKSKPV